MYVIEARDQKRHWISGIFESKGDLKEYISQIPEYLIDIQHIVELPFTNYPFYIIEKLGYKYLKKDEFLKYLDQFIYDDTDEESVFFNFYFINSDYKPDRPGTDYMGILRHDHVTSRFFKFYKKDREKFLRRNRFL